MEVRAYPFDPVMTSIDVAPDIVSSTHEYAKRFSGSTGAYFLEVQQNYCYQLLEPLLKNGKIAEGSKVLEIGGGHCELTQFYLDLGYQVTIHGSDFDSLSRARDLGFGDNPNVKFLVCPLQHLDVGNEEYDLVSSIRMMAHVENWQLFLKEISRVSKNGVIFDFANTNSFNILSPVFFRLKKYVEKSTRPYNCQSKSEVSRTLLKLGFKETLFKSQYFFPMGLHRLIDRADLSKKVEGYIEQTCLKIMGSPMLGFARKK